MKKFYLILFLIPVFLYSQKKIVSIEKKILNENTYSDTTWGDGSYKIYSSTDVKFYKDDDSIWQEVNHNWSDSGNYYVNNNHKYKIKILKKIWKDSSIIIKYRKKILFISPEGLQETKFIRELNIKPYLLHSETIRYDNIYGMGINMEIDCKNGLKINKIFDKTKGTSFNADSINAPFIMEGDFNLPDIDSMDTEPSILEILKLKKPLITGNDSVKVKYKIKTDSNGIKKIVKVIKGKMAGKMIITDLTITNQSPNESGYFNSSGTYTSSSTPYIHYAASWPYENQYYGYAKFNLSTTGIIKDLVFYCTVNYSCNPPPPMSGTFNVYFYDQNYANSPPSSANDWNNWGCLHGYIGWQYDWCNPVPNLYVPMNGGCGVGGCATTAVCSGKYYSKPYVAIKINMNYQTGRQLWVQATNLTMSATFIPDAIASVNIAPKIINMHTP